MGEVYWKILQTEKASHTDEEKKVRLACISLWATPKIKRNIFISVCKTISIYLSPVLFTGRCVEVSQIWMVFISGWYNFGLFFLLSSNFLDCLKLWSHAIFTKTIKSLFLEGGERHITVYFDEDDNPDYVQTTWVWIQVCLLTSKINSTVNHDLFTHALPFRLVFLSLNHLQLILTPASTQEINTGIWPARRKFTHWVIRTQVKLSPMLPLILIYSFQEGWQLTESSGNSS